MCYCVMMYSQYDLVTLLQLRKKTSTVIRTTHNIVYIQNFYITVSYYIPSFSIRGIPLTNQGQGFK